MTARIITEDIIETGFPQAVTIQDPNEPVVWITQGTIVARTSDIGNSTIFGSVDNARLIIDGQVFNAAFNGVSFDADGVAVNIGASGSIWAHGSGISMGFGFAVNTSVTNQGTINVQGFNQQGWGIDARFASGDLVNLGDILSAANGVAYGNGDSSIENDGLIRAIGRAVDLRDGENLLVNAGRLSSRDSDGALLADSFNTAINSGEIMGGAFGVRLGGGNNVLNNSGSITGLQTGVRTDGAGNRISNDGSINGIDSFGVQMANASGHRLFNSGTIASDGDHAVNMQVSPGGIGLIVNSGEITTAGNGATAILLDAAGNVVLRNSGSIEAMSGWGTVGAGLGTLSLRNDGVIAGLSGSVLGGLGEVALHNTGSLAGQVFLSPSDDLIRNLGVIDGNVTTASGDDILRNMGEIIGDIDMGNGANTLANHGEIAGDIDMGGNTDLLRNMGTIHGDIDMGTGADILRNFGEIIGDVDMGGGADQMNNHGTVQGSVDMGAGPGSMINRGLVTGDVVFGGTSAVVYDGSGSGFVAGRIMAGSGGSVMTGGDGDDRLQAGAGQDVLTGGAGADVFIFLSAAHIGLSPAQRDRITDFTSGEDRIDLSALGDDLVFIGTDDFSGAAGEIRFNPGQGFLMGDLNGNGNANFRLELDGVASLMAEDFIL